MASPVYKISIKRRDGKPQTFTNYAGQEVTSQYRNVGALFANKFGGFDLVLDGPEITLSKADYFINVNAVKPRGEQGATPKKKGGNDDGEW